MWPFRKRNRPTITPGSICICDSGPEDRAELAAVLKAADGIGEGIDGLPTFGELFLKLHPKFSARGYSFPPIGYWPSSDVHEAIFETLDAYVVEAKAALHKQA